MNQSCTLKPRPRLSLTYVDVLAPLACTTLVRAYPTLVSIPEIPQDIALEVLAWIPATVVFKFRRLSHSFNNLLLSAQFTNRLMLQLPATPIDEFDHRFTSHHARRYTVTPIEQLLFLPGLTSFQTKYTDTYLTGLQKMWWTMTPSPSFVIPPTLGECTSLVHLNLSNCSLAGEIPAAIGKLTKLVFLKLSGNRLTGSIPREVGKLVALEELCLFDNYLSGCIPKEIGQMVRLKEVWLGSNRLTGCIPEEMGQLKELRELSLRDNELSGEIPASIGRLPLLERLQVERNQLSRDFPVEVMRLRNLTF
ncbi:hypothetical protein HDU98_003060 [Podochytrium sp. JEL0797]|nr:hypothetical protein HDU98_003060 [Podochytrium sp. JEL0797]